jgi:hypothetical protein
MRSHRLAQVPGSVTCRSEANATPVGSPIDIAKKPLECPARTEQRQGAGSKDLLVECPLSERLFSGLHEEHALRAEN